MNRAVPLVLSVSLFMENMDSSVIATALPTIAADFGTSPIALKLALTSYYVALAAFIPISGRLADRFGPRQVFQSAIWVFIAGSIACAQAGSLGELIAARFLQGAGGAMMTPVGRLLLVRSSSKADLVGAMAWFSMPALVGPLMGPPLGGAIATYLDWRWIFWVNVPIALVGVILAARVLPLIPPRRDVRFDWRGFALSAGACIGLVFGASVVSLPVLPPALGLALLAAGAGFWALYLRHARREREPVLRLSLMDSDAFRAAVVSGFAFRIGVGAVPFLLPLMLQLGFGFTPLQSGLVSCAAIGGAIGMKVLVKGVLRRWGFRTTLIVAALGGGALIAPMGYWRPDITIFFLVGLLAVGGLMRSLFFTSINALAFADIPTARTGDATAILSAGQQVSIALGVALAGAILETLLTLDGRDVLLPRDFTVAFLIVGLASMLAALAFLNMGRGAGSEISGHRLAAE